MWIIFEIYLKYSTINSTFVTRMHILERTCSSETFPLDTHDDDANKRILINGRKIIDTPTVFISTERFF